MKISFIIPAHNEEEELPATLAALCAAAPCIDCDYEIIVVDDDSTDRTAQVATEYGARVVRVKRRQISAVRNEGANAAVGTHFVFIDADTKVNAAVLKRVIWAFEGGAIGGGTRVAFDVPLGRFLRSLLVVWNFFSMMTRSAAGSFVFVRRDAFEAVGGFDETIFATEELILSEALNRRGRFVILLPYVHTSARKVADGHLLQFVGVAFRTVLSGGRHLRSRDGLAYWYRQRAASEAGNDAHSAP